MLNHSRKHTSDILPILYVRETKLRFIHLLDKKEIEIEIKNKIKISIKLIQSKYPLIL